MKIERQPRNVERKLNGRQCSIFHELMHSFYSLLFSTPAILPLGGKEKPVKGLRGRLAVSVTVCACRRSESLLICPLGRQRRKITDCVGGQA